jgi:hypothetical protein
MVCMESTVQGNTTDLAHIPGKNLQQLSLPPREKPVQREIQYSVITISLNGN